MGRRDTELLMQALGMAIGLGKDYIGYRQGQQDRNDRKTQQDQQFGLQSAQFDNLKAEQKSRGAEVTDQLNMSVSNAGRSFITPGAETTAGGTTGSYGASVTGGGMNDVTPPPAPPDISPAAAPSMTENGPPSAISTPPTGAQTMAKLQAATQAPKPDISVNPDAYAGQGGLPPRLPTITSGPPPSAKPAFTLSDGRLVSQIDPAMTPQGRAEVFAEQRNVAANALKNRQAADRLGIRGTAFDPNHDYVGDAHLSDETKIAGVRATAQAANQANAPHYGTFDEPGPDGTVQHRVVNMTGKDGQTVGDVQGKGKVGPGGDQTRTSNLLTAYHNARDNEPQMTNYENRVLAGKVKFGGLKSATAATANPMHPPTGFFGNAVQGLSQDVINSVDPAAAEYMRGKSIHAEAKSSILPRPNVTNLMIESQIAGVQAGKPNGPTTYAAQNRRQQNIADMRAELLRRGLPVEQVDAVTGGGPAAPPPPAVKAPAPGTDPAFDAYHKAHPDGE